MYPLCKNQRKKTENKKKVQEAINTVGSRFGIDVTDTDKIMSMGDNKYVHFKIDYRSNKIFVNFWKKKSEV